MGRRRSTTRSLARSSSRVFESKEYELLDFGAGRKLERFGAELLDRPSPAADGSDVVNPELWGSATARFHLIKGAKGAKGAWNTDLPPWSIGHGDNLLEMKLSASGNVGVFPEQADNWDWIAQKVRECKTNLSSRRPRVLNLFAYTGGASMAAAAAGAEVAHVDSSGPTVTWAKRNAEVSGMADLPVRWLVEDAMKFVAREVRRGNFYDGIIADPPTYGHGPKGRPFKFSQHLDELMQLCGELLDPNGVSGRFLVFSCHAPDFAPEGAEWTVNSVVRDSSRVEAGPLVLTTADGRKLDAGVAARWSGA